MKKPLFPSAGSLTGSGKRGYFFNLNLTGIIHFVMLQPGLYWQRLMMELNQQYKLRTY